MPLILLQLFAYLPLHLIHIHLVLIHIVILQPPLSTLKNRLGPGKSLLPQQQILLIYLGKKR